MISLRSRNQGDHRAEHFETSRRRSNNHYISIAKSARCLSVAGKAINEIAATLKKQEIGEQIDGTESI